VPKHRADGVPGAVMREDAQVNSRVNWQRLGLAMAVALGLTIIVYSFSKVQTGGDAQGLPDGIEAISPESGDQVQRQSEVVVNLAPGYDGILFLQGSEIPADQVSFDLGTNVLNFPCTPGATPPTDAAPQPGTGVARPPQPPCSVTGPGDVQLPQGPVSMRVEFWRIVEGRANGVTSYSWSFSTT
jgi:hypothetical protein